MKLNKISIMLLEDIIILNIFVLPIKKILQFKSPEFISSHDKFTEILDTYVRKQPQYVPFNVPKVNSSKMQIPKLNKIG